MNVNDLRAALHERAGTVTDHDAVRRVAQVRARVKVARRRRIAGAAALTAVVLAVVSAVAVLPDPVAGPDPDRPAVLPDPVPTEPLPTIQHEGFLSHSGEYNLVAAAVGQRGQSSLALTIPPHPGDIHVSMLCHGIGGPVGDYWVSGYGGDRPARPDGLWCGREPDGPVVPGVSGPAPGPWMYDEGMLFGPSATPLTVHVELTQELDENGATLDNPDEMGTYVPVEHPDVVLGMGVYSVAEPVVTVAGVDIRPLVGLDGQDYAYREHRSSKPGEGSLTWTLEPSPVERYYDFVASNAADPGNPRSGVEAALDGDSCQYAIGMDPQFRAGGCQLSPGVPHTITLTVHETPRPDVEMGIVLYERTG